MRLTFIINALTPGGAERVLTTLANHWAEKGWEITIITFDGYPPFYELHPDIDYRPLDLVTVSANWKEAVFFNLKRLWQLRRAIRRSKPEMVICFGVQQNIITAVAAKGLKIPVLVSERNLPESLSGRKLWHKIRPWAYSQSAGLIVQTDAIREYFSKCVKAPIWLIPNPVRPPEIRKTNGAHVLKKDARKTLLAMGRVNEQKGFDLLIQAFSKVAHKYPDWSLKIWGAIHDKKPAQELENLRDELGLTDSVELAGVTKQPAEKMMEADLFALSSRYEGFPNVLCEAMACGLPVISFDCPTGPRAIIRDGVDGLLVPAQDVSGLAEGLDRLMGDEAYRKSLAARAQEVSDRFSLEKVSRMWEQVIATTLEKVSEQP